MAETRPGALQRFGEAAKLLSRSAVAAPPMLGGLASGILTMTDEPEPSYEAFRRGFEAFPGAAMAERVMEETYGELRESGWPELGILATETMAPAGPLGMAKGLGGLAGKAAGTGWFSLPAILGFKEAGRFREVPAAVAEMSHARLPASSARYVDPPHGGQTLGAFDPKERFSTYTLTRTAPDHPSGPGNVDITAAFKIPGAETEEKVIQDAITRAVAEADSVGGVGVTLDAYADPGPASYYKDLGFEVIEDFPYDPAQDTAKAFAAEQPRYQYMRLTPEAMERYRQRGNFQRLHFERTGQMPTGAQMRDYEETIQRSIAEPGGTSSSTPRDLHNPQEPGGDLPVTLETPRGGLTSSEQSSMPVDKGQVWGGLAAGDEGLVTPGIRPPREQRGMPRLEVEVGGPVTERLEEMYSPANVARVEEGIRAGQEIGADQWYNLANVRQSALDILGPEQGQEKFERFARLLAAFSPRSAVRPNIRRATLSHVLQEQGKDFPTQTEGLLASSGLGGLNLPDRYGHLNRLLAGPMERQVRAGVPFDPRTQPKVASFSENLMGNWQPLTADTHFAKQVGFSPPGAKTPLAKSHYGALEEYGSSIGAGMGLEPAATQSALWSGLAKMTGVRDPRNFEDVFKTMVTKTAELRDVTPAQAIADFWEGKAPLFGIGGAAITLGMLEEEEPGA